ncbi:MAG: hypothetical protein PHE84_01770 [bacterium]|nr:hypothetical protein [bacterium]
MENNNERIKELKKKEELTDKEMQELIALSPPGTFKKGPNLQNIGVVDIEKAFKNLKEGPDRSKNAMRNECYLEVISLRLQHTEFWLRIFWVVKNGKGKIFFPDDKRTFGKIIDDCEKLNFRKDLINKLRKFNSERINGIHKYLLGATDYSELFKICENSKGIDSEIGEYVRSDCFIPI